MLCNYGHKLLWGAAVLDQRFRILAPIQRKDGLVRMTFDFPSSRCPGLDSFRYTPDKIVLGTIGSLPACDRYFVTGFKTDGHVYSYLGVSSSNIC